MGCGCEDEFLLRAERGQPGGLPFQPLLPGECRPPAYTRPGPPREGLGALGEGEGAVEAKQPFLAELLLDEPSE